jgi:hypothetical protein
VVDRAVLLRQVPATSDIAGLVRLVPGDDEQLARATSAVQELAAGSGVQGVLRPEEFVDRRSELLVGFQRVIQWMLLFTLLQALVGVVNTLLLSVGERRREFGLLRAAGAGRRDILRLVVFEGAGLALVGTGVGLVVGIGGAWLGVRALSSLGVDQFVVPPVTVVATAVAAITVGIAATVLPGRWAAGVPPLDAVADHGGVRSRPRPVQRPRLRRRGRPAFRFEELTVPVAQAPVETPLRPPPVPQHLVAGVHLSPPSSTGALTDLLPPPMPVTSTNVVDEAAAPVPAPEWVSGGLFGSDAAALGAVGPPAAGVPTDSPPPYTQVRPDPVDEQRGPVGPSHQSLFGQDLPPAPDPLASDRIDLMVLPDSDPPSPDDRTDGADGGSTAGSDEPPPPAGPFGPTVFAADPSDDQLDAQPPPEESVDLAEVGADTFADAVARLRPGSVDLGAPALSVLGGALAPGEVVVGVLTGRARGLPCAVAVTDRRVLVVADRRPDPIVQSLHPTRTGLRPLRQVPNGPLSVLVVDGDRVLEVTAVGDPDVAEMMSQSGSAVSGRG